MRIAVVSNDTVRVDEFFANAKRFLIYDMGNDGPAFITERFSEPLSQEFVDDDMMDWVTDIISDCELVYSAAIKEKPAQALRKKGIEHVAYHGAIADIPPSN